LAQDNERLQRLAYEARVLQGQGEGIQAQMEALRASAAQAREAIDALKALDAKGGSGFVPVGAGVFAPAEVRKGSVVVDVGAGVLVEKTIAEAGAILEARLKEIADAQGKLQAGAAKLGARMREIDTEARGLISSGSESGEAL